MVFKSFANATMTGQGQLLLVFGAPGTGKTLTLRYFVQEAEKAGMNAPFVNAERGEDETAIIRKLYSELSLMRDFRPAQSTPEGFTKLLNIIWKMGRKKLGTVILIDDIDNMKKPDEALFRIINLLKEGWRKRNVSFVLSSTRDFKVESDFVSKMVLEPFDEHDTHELMEKALGKGPPKIGEECLQTLLSDTGGNPKLLKIVSYYIYERLHENEKVITKGHYLAYLPQIMSMLSREWFGRLYQETPSAERAILSVLATSEEGMHVSDIAKKLGKPLGPVTSLIKRLLDSGQVVKLNRGKYRIFSKLYARYVVQRSVK